MRLPAHLEKYLERFFTFLYIDGLEATNGRAEQALRPAVVNRKVWGGNRTPAGARTQSVLTSVLLTCHQRGHDALTVLSQLIRSPLPLPLPSS